jgi:hypothetical protein
MTAILSGEVGPIYLDPSEARDPSHFARDFQSFLLFSHTLPSILLSTTQLIYH